jgi:ssDNA-binding Zn-finger/Zn-ribbon topoisomerase 1
MSWADIFFPVCNYIFNEKPICIMIRGIVILKCPVCGTVFPGLDIEWQATVLSAPVSCPHCKHSCNPGADRAGLIDKIRYIRAMKAAKKTGGQDTT